VPQVNLRDKPGVQTQGVVREYGEHRVEMNSVVVVERGHDMVQ
jgi:hypothetical protein